MRRLVVLSLVLAACGKARVDPTAEPMAEFSKRVDSYIVLRDSMAAKIGPLDMTKSQAEIAARATTPAHQIVEARAAAKQGDLFTPEAATIFATLIKEEYRRRGDSTMNARADAQRELKQEEVADFEPQVNLVWPTSYPLPTFPATLLPLLPALPENKLEYRIVRHALLVRDIEANLIIDFMPNAVPTP